MADLSPANPASPISPGSPVIRELVVANRILANEGIIDAYGHVSVRHPERADRFFLSCSRSPEFVTAEDIMEFDLSGEPVDAAGRHPYLERFIHAGIYEANPGAQAAIHAHTHAVLPFTVTDIPLMAVTHDGHHTGARVPRWDIRTGFGDATDLLVSSLAMGRDLASAFTAESFFVLMRGHGYAGWAPSLQSVVYAAIYLTKNAEVLTTARLLGGVPTPLSAGEMLARRTSPALQPGMPAMRRPWEYWAQRAGVTRDGL